LRCGGRILVLYKLVAIFVTSDPIHSQAKTLKPTLKPSGPGDAFLLMSLIIPNISYLFGT
jgi:hypothetical protein